MPRDKKLTKNTKASKREEMTGRRKRDESSEDDNDSSWMTEDEDEEFDIEEYHKFLAKTFPSKYMDNKVKHQDKNVKQDKKRRKTEDTSSSSEEIEVRQRKTNKKRIIESDSEEDNDDDSSVKSSETLGSEDTYSDSDVDGSDSENEQSLGKKGKFNIIFTIGGATEEDEEEVDDEDFEIDSEAPTENEDDPVSSDSDTDVEVSEPEPEPEPKKKSKTTRDVKTKSNNARTSEKKKKNDTEETSVLNDLKELIAKAQPKEKELVNETETVNETVNKNVDENNINDETEESIIEMLKDLQSKNSNSLLIKECIRVCENKLKEKRKKEEKKVEKTKLRNERIFRRISRDKNKTNDFEFFNKMGIEEQNKIIKEIKEINKITRIEKPYKITLLEANIPVVFKSAAMKKINTLKYMDNGSGEFYKIKNWVDTFMRIPFGKYNTLPINMSDGVDKCHEFMENAQKILHDAVYGLNDAKMQIMQMLGQLVTNPKAIGSAIAIHGPPGTGKCHVYNTPILMYNGTIKMVQDIIVGDLVMGDDSTPRKVVDLGRGEDDLYEVIQSNGDVYGVNSEHILCLKKIGHVISNENIIEMSVKDFLKLPKDISRDFCGYHVAVEFPEKPIMCDPYLMGEWLMNGKCNKMAHEYKTNSKINRMALLAGMIDSDKTNSPDNIYRCVTHTNKELIEDVVFLARSLGYDAYQENDKVVIHGYEVDPSIMYSESQIRINAIGRGKYYGFTLDGNHRYLLKDFTVTHNTSLVKEGISKILNRPFAFIALGGATDSSFLEGHSYTYEGSTWGQIVQILIDSKCMNPVIYFDELDKISETPKGEEIAGILTHLTDTTQNSQFHDKYFAEIDFDLSKCLFIFSYNDENKVSPILKDRMYRIQTKGYNQKQKTMITNNYLLPRIREQVKFDNGSIIIPDATIQYIIENHCGKEDGVRNLKRCLEIIHTKLNLYRLMRPGSNLFEEDMSLKVEFPFTVTKDIVDKLIKKKEQDVSLYHLYV